MNIEEKLQHFMDVSMVTANEKYQKIVEDYKAKLDRNFEEYKNEAYRKAIVLQKKETENLNREAKKKLSQEQLEIKHEITIKLDKLKDSLFDEVLELLADYKKSTDYYTLLLNQIQEAKKVARLEPITIYIDPLDTAFKEKLEKESGVNLTVSEYSFMGGTRAVIASRNILIDNSFKAKLEDVKAHYNIEY